MRAPTSANHAIQTQSERPTHDEDDELEEEEKRRCGAKYRGDVATHEGPVRRSSLAEDRDCVFLPTSYLVGNVSLELFPSTFHKRWSAKVPSG